VEGNQRRVGRGVKPNLEINKIRRLEKVLKEQRRDYLYGGAFAKERTRLASIEALWDPGSQSLLDEVGLGPGWQCLEVGAGGGSLVEWMVKRGAAVTAVDIDTRFIEHLASDTVDVRCVDVRTDELPLGEFDLVHARLVLEHLSDRRHILDRLAATLRPGGWIIIEDYELSCFSLGDEPHFEATVRAIVGFMEQAGFDRTYGRRLVADLADAGFSDVRGEGRTRIIDAHSPGFDFFKLSFESIRDTVVEAGALGKDDADATAARFDDKTMRIFTPIVMAGIGRRPI
jgi:2-polyprenyl-3-methyl-5-hydroxy-6-metoxy-1,4-benzoquinol methylase